MDSKAKTKEKHLSLISFCFLTLSSPCGYPVQSARSGSLTDKKNTSVSPGASVAQPLADKRSRRKTKRADRSRFSLACKL
uniref:hypothetical protein n=1 Tax=uncultured Dysgonomonas sp. TaxID=206096 RepID=UPI0026396DE5|nr:hypothetical protein [uncultured Dysgonomonas sp.]